MSYNWEIKGIQEIDRNGECVLVCEETDFNVLEFFKIIQLEPNNVQFEAMDDTSVKDNRRDSKIQDEDTIETY